MTKKYNVKNALLLGAFCTIVYLAVYISRNVLSAVSPQMITHGIASENFIGTMSSIFFFAYAIGQLFNGIIGDVVKSKYMIAIGLILAGISSFILPFICHINIVTYCLYGVVGFSLSMIYGPMTKTIAENTKPNHAIKCNLGLNFSAYFGAPIAGVFALFLAWNNVFNMSAVILIILGLLCFIIFSIFESKNIIEYNNSSVKKESNNDIISSISILIKRDIIKFTFVSILTGIIRTTVLFWLPTYLMQYLDFDEKTSTSIFTATSLVISVGSFAAIYLYKILKESINKTLFFSFVFAAILFLGTFIVKNDVLNIILLVLAIMSSNCAATMMWSFYCPSLANTGLVSSATGYLDFISYMSASISSKLFANAVTSVGWDGLILVWFVLMVLGIVVSIPFKKRCEA